MARVDLEEVKNVPEDEFQQNLFEWIEQTDIAKELQSKLRSDLFQNFGKTALGRQIAAQHQQSQRMVLSSMVLVLNTLVAEFLYAHNCHFSLSVFSSEVPYKNVLPDFENVHKFRFDSVQLDDILKALALDLSNLHITEIIRMYTQSQERDSTATDRSLLYCIIKMLSQAVSTNVQPQNDVNSPPESQQQNDNCHHCKGNRKAATKDELQSKYYKPFHKYLELLSQHVVEISENIKQLKQPIKSSGQQHSQRSLNRRLDKISESLANLSKSNKKARKVSQIIRSITRLTNEVERCSRNVAKYSNAISQPSPDVATKAKLPADGSYTEWLNKMTESTFGRRFIKNLETAQEKAIATEVQRIKENFNEKFETTRKLIKFHYKQKTFEKFRATMLRSPMMQSRRDDFNELIDEKLRALKEKENCWKQSLVLASTQTETITTHDRMVSVDINNTNNCVPAKITNDSVIPANRTKVMETVKPQINAKKTIPIELFNEPLRPIEPTIDNMVLAAKNRLQELETESEQLDKSFHRYLKKQNEEKRSLADDVDKVWRQYECAKNMIKTFVVPETYRSRRNVTEGVRYHENIPSDTVPIANDDATIVPRIINETSQFMNPYKKLHDKLTTTGTLNSLIDKKGKNENTIPVLAAVTLQQNACTTSADKINQIALPMKISQIAKKSAEKESKTHLRLSRSNDNPCSEPCDNSSFMKLKNVSSSDDVGHSKQSDVSLKSKVSEIAFNSPGSIRTEGLKDDVFSAVARKSEVEETGDVQTNVAVDGQSVPEITVPTTNVKERTKDISSLFEKMQMENNAKHSTSSESSVSRKISTGHKSTSSDEFWK